MKIESLFINKFFYHLRIRNIIRFKNKFIYENKKNRIYAVFFNSLQVHSVWRAAHKEPPKIPNTRKKITLLTKLMQKQTI